MSERITTERSADQPDAPQRTAWWTRPQVLVAALLLAGATAFFVVSRPPDVGPAPELELPDASGETAVLREVTLFRVADGVATPLLREVPVPEDPSARTEALLAALRDALIETGDWPADLPTPSVFTLRIERDDAVVLDVPEHDVVLDVASERTVIASLERTLIEQGVERIAYLRGGQAVDAWLGDVLTPSTLE